jgi:large subunit ribosomal protein L7A
VANEPFRLSGHFVVGLNQTTKALEQAIASEVFLAKDADRRVTSRILALAKQNNTPITWVDTMRQLGAACGIEVGAAAAALIAR